MLQLVWISSTHLVEYVGYPRTAVEVIHLHPFCSAALAVYTVSYTGCELGQEGKEDTTCRARSEE